MNLSPEWVKAFAEHAELSAREAAFAKYSLCGVNLGD
jgi:hypothetical protein